MDIMSFTQICVFFDQHQASSFPVSCLYAKLRKPAASSEY